MFSWEIAAVPKFKVLLTDYAWPDLDIERKILADGDCELVVADKSKTDAESLEMCIRDR